MKNERKIKKLLLAAIAIATCAVMLVAAMGCTAQTTRSADGGLLESCAACTALCAGCTCLTCSALTCAATEGYYTYSNPAEISDLYFLD